MPRCSNFANLLAKSDGYVWKHPSARLRLSRKLLGEHPRLWRVRESRRWLYFPKKNSTTE